MSYRRLDTPEDGTGRMVVDMIFPSELVVNYGLEMGEEQLRAFADAALRAADEMAQLTD